MSYFKWIDDYTSIVIPFQNAIEYLMQTEILAIVV